MPSVKLCDLFDINLFVDMHQTGMVGRQFHPRLPLAILNYTHEAQFSRTWNDVTTQCRGLIYNLHTEEIVARPFRKFFNAEELGPSKLGQAFGKNIQATDKMDGSLGVLYPDSSTACGWSIATRGSFTSPQALKASAMLEDAYMEYAEDGILKGWVPSTESTYLFEIIYPENRIVLDYGDTQALVLLATVNTATGHVGGPDSSSGWPGPRTKIFPATSIKEVRALPIRQNAEGFVLRNEKTGFMCKVKYEEYVRLHRIIYGMNEKRVYNHLREGRPVTELYVGVPEEFYEWITNTVDRLGDQYCAIRQQALNDYEEVEEITRGKGRKAFAEWATNPRYPYPGLLFSLLDKQGTTKWLDRFNDSIWKMIPYDGRNKMTAEQSEDVA